MPRPISHQNVAGRATQIAHAQRLNVVFASQIPYDEIDGLVRQIDGFLVDLDTDGRQIGIRENALDIALDQTRLAYREAAEHADFPLEQRRHCCS